MGHPSTATRRPLRPWLRRRGRLLVVVTAVVGAAWFGAVGGLVAPPAVSAEDGPPPSPANVLDLPRADVAVLDATGPDGTPRLLAVDPIGPGSAELDLSVLERDGTWRVATTTRLDLSPTDGLGFAPPMLIGLGGDRFAILTTSTEGGGSRLVTVDVTGGTAAPTIVERGRLRPADEIERAGAADVDGDGVTDLVVTTSRVPDLGPGCPRTSFQTYPAGDLTTPAPPVVVNILAGPAVIGRFDEVPGDDLAVYGWTACATGSSPLEPLELVALRLRDGTRLAAVAADDEVRPALLPPPVRLDVDGDGRHELLAQGPRGLSVLDPSSGWDALRIGDRDAPRIGSRDALPLGVAPGPERVVWLGPPSEGRPSIHSQPVWRAADGSLASGPAAVRADTVPATLAWSAADQATRADAARTGRPVAWQGRLSDSSCADLFVPDVRLTCADPDLGDGPSWVGSRPLLAFDDPGGDGTRVLVAAGLTWLAAEQPPVTPDPWGDGSGGRWRALDGSMFALAEVPTTELTGAPASMSLTADPVAILGPAAVLRSDPGARLSIGILPLLPGAPAPASVFDPLAPTDVPTQAPIVLQLHRVPTGSADGGLQSIEVPLGAATLGGTPADRWALIVLHLDDLGRVSQGQRFEVRRDTASPVTTLDAPFLSAPWPLTARLAGTTEPGATVTLDGAEPVVADLTGAFTIETQLAPWPQRLSIGATDPSRNASTLEVSIVGGVDYRVLPWAPILVVALVAAVVVSGLLGTRRRHGPVDADTAGRALSDGPGPELEDLPPGSGL